MPQYTFLCEKCQEKFEIVCSIKHYDENQACPQCNSSEHVCRDYAEDLSIVRFNPTHLSECKTIGQYADLQTKKLGKEKASEMIKNFKTQKSEGKKLPNGMSRYSGADKMHTPLTLEKAKKKRGKHGSF